MKIKRREETIVINNIIVFRVKNTNFNPPYDVSWWDDDKDKLPDDVAKEYEEKYQAIIKDF
jgi:hypothetical protein